MSFPISNDELSTVVVNYKHASFRVLANLYMAVASHLTLVQTVCGLVQNVITATIRNSHIHTTHFSVCSDSARQIIFYLKC